jgi:hypothetical protein
MLQSASTTPMLPLHGSGAQMRPWPEQQRPEYQEYMMDQAMVDVMFPE